MNVTIRDHSKLHALLSEVPSSKSSDMNMGYRITEETRKVKGTSAGRGVGESKEREEQGTSDLKEELGNKGTLVMEGRGRLMQKEEGGEVDSKDIWKSHNKAVVV